MVSKINVVIIAVVVFVFIFIIGGGDGRNVSQHIVDVGLPAAYSYKTCKTLRSAALDQVAIRALCLFMYAPVPPITHCLTGHERFDSVAELYIH